MRPRRAALALAVLCGVWTAAAGLTAANDTTSEVRALWVLRTSLTTPSAIATLVKTAHDHGFNTLLVQVRGRGDAYYTTALEPRRTLYPPIEANRVGRLRVSELHELFGLDRLA